MESKSIALLIYGDQNSDRNALTDTKYKGLMEVKWIPQLQESHSIPDESLPLIWDIDLFINDVNTQNTEKKYSLCEINISCVSPFPPSCIDFIVSRLKSV